MLSHGAVEILQAIRFQLGVQRFKALRRGHRCQEAAPAVLDQVLHLPLVIAFPGTAEPVPEQVVTDEFAEGARPLAFAVAAYLRHGKLGVVVQDRQRDAPEKSEGAHMTIEKGLRGFRRIGLHERRV